MKVLFLTNLPSPYRVDFFNEMAKMCDLTVSFEAKSATERNDKWKNSSMARYKDVYQHSIKYGNKTICFGVLNLLAEDYDQVILGGYSTPTAMLAIEYLRLHKIPFWLEVDGGLVKNDTKIKYQFKRHFISSASGWFSTGKNTTEYLIHYGANKDKIFVYPFTSLLKSDILPCILTADEKAHIRHKIGCVGGKMIISVGRFSYLGGYGKGYDILIEALARCPKDYQLYIIGDEPTPEFIELKKGLNQLHFVGFKTKAELEDYYRAADLFCLQTRGDVWGLVVNEAMAHGLPVITSDQCVAGRELIENGKNGYVVPVEDAEQLAGRMIQVLSDSDQLLKMSKESLKKIRLYTIENMARCHINVLRGLER